MFTKYREQWDEMDSKFKALLIALVVGGGIGIYIQSQKNKDIETKKAALSTGSNNPPGQLGSFVPGAKAVNWQAIPSSNRNQGLEDVLAEMQKLRDEIHKGRQGGGEPGKTNLQQDPQQMVDLNDPLPGATKSAQTNDLPKNTPPPVKFDTDKAPGAVATPSAFSDSSINQTQIKSARPRMKVWESATPTELTTTSPDVKLIIPINSALEGVMLSGINARPSGAIGGAVGSATTANDVGAPFVSRIKGDATLPNGWKLSDLGDCFMGGSAVAVLSAERAYAISNTISCIASNGETFEAPVKAYGLDIDGIQGIAGKVVSKQGAILLQAALTGVASGLGTALTPTPVQGYNSSAQGGTQAVQYPDAQTVAATAIGTGMHNATAQLSRFYLEYARETFPVIEVVAGTRITWIFKETVEFKRTRKAN